MCVQACTRAHTHTRPRAFACFSPSARRSHVFVVSRANIATREMEHGRERTAALPRGNRNDYDESPQGAECICKNRVARFARAPYIDRFTGPPHARFGPGPFNEGGRALNVEEITSRRRSLSPVMSRDRRFATRRLTLCFSRSRGFSQDPSCR